MATRKIVPRANGEGAIGDNTAGAEKYWGGGFFNTINGANAIEMAAFNGGLQWKASTAYAKGSIVFTSGLSAGMYLECLKDGTSNTDKFAIPSSIVPNTTTITDNTVTWIVREICSTQIDDSYSRKPNTTYLRGEIRFLYGKLPVGWFLECSVAGVSGSGDLTITTPAEGSTVTDGTVTWVMKKMGTGSGSADGVPLGAILPLAHNSTIPAGYLLCDGSAVSRTMYPNLFAAIGTTYGAGDGSTTFNVPDYNAAKRFAQGDTVAGTVKQAGLPNITGTAGGVDITINHTGDSGALKSTATHFSWSVPNGSSQDTMGIVSLDASLSNPIYGASHTVQPNALTARYIIKAFDGQTADSALIDITQYANELANKANRQLSNLDTANLACHVVVDSHYDSTTGDWWRKYDDGWVEQGGYKVTGVASAIITLLKPMDDSNYHMDINLITGNQDAMVLSTSTKSSTQLTIYTYNTTVGIYWSVCGMGAQS